MMNYVIGALVFIIATPVLAEEVACSSEFVKRWSEQDASGNPIYYDAIRITASPDFEKIDSERNINKSRVNYLPMQIIANLKLTDGRSTKIMGDIFYGYKDGEFLPQQLFFEQKIDIESLDSFPVINCELGAV